MLTNYLKRTLSFVMAMIMVFSMVPVQAFATETEETHEHCEVCGQHDCVCPPTQIVDAEVVVASADPVQAFAAEPEEPEHTCDFVAGEVVAPTCGAAGYTVYTCGCGAVENRDEVPATGVHDYVDAVVGPTETEQGYTVHTCSVCGHSYKDSYTDPVTPVEEPVADEKFQRQIPASWTDEMKEIQTMIDKELDYYLGYYGFKMFDETRFAPMIQAQIAGEEVLAELAAEWETIYAQIEDIIVSKMDDNERENARMAAERIDGLMKYYFEEEILSEEQIEELVVSNPVYLDYADLTYEHGVAINVLDLTYDFSKLTVTNLGAAAARNYSNVVPTGGWSSGAASISGDLVGGYDGSGYNHYYHAADTTLTLTNNSSVKSVLSFTYSVTTDDTDDRAYINGNSVTGSNQSFSAELDPGASVTIKLEVFQNKKGLFQDPSKNGAHIVLTAISLEEIVPDPVITVEYDSDLGSVSLNDATAAAGAGQTVESGATVSLTASGSNAFLGWVDATNAIISTDNPYSFTASANRTIKAVFAQDGGDAVFAVGTTVAQSYSEKYTLIVTLGDNFNYHTVTQTHLFTDLQAAIDAANSSSSKAIMLMNNGTITGNYTIPSGVTLLIPCDDLGTLATTQPLCKGLVGAPAATASITAYRTLTMASGSSITIAEGGAMNVNAILFAIGGSDRGGGSPLGQYGYVKMEDGSNITVQSGGGLYTYGYINGSGAVTVKSGGKVYEAFQYEDFRGGSVSSTMSQDTDHAVFPLSDYYVQNVMVPMTLEAGATEGSYASLHMSNATFGTGVEFISGSNAMFNLKSGSVTKRYDHATDRLVFDLNGNVEIAGINMSIGAGTYKMDMNSADFVLPINSNMVVNLNSGSLSLQQEVALLPGAEVNIKSGANCTLVKGGALYLYDNSDWGPYVSSNPTTFLPAYYVPERQHTMSAGELKDAQIVINGSVTANGDVYTTSSGAAIKGTEGAVIYMTPATSGTTYQYNQTEYIEFSMSNDKLTPAQLQNADGSYYKTADTPKDADGNYLPGYYIYEDGQWHYRCKDNVHTPGADATCGDPQVCTVCGYEIAPATGKHNPGAAATCTTDQTCTICGDIVKEKLGHDEKTLNAVPATCYATGLTEGKVCQREGCGVTLVEQTVTDMIDHTWGKTPVSSVASTCTEAGSQTFKCTVCQGAVNDGKIEEAAIGTDVRTVDATGHQNVTAFEKESATCTFPGLEAYWYCSDCQVYFSDADYTKKIEDLTAWKSSGGEGYIAALGHQNITEHAEVPAKCNAYGTKAYYTCGVCGKSYTGKTGDNLSGEISDLDTWLTNPGQGRIDKIAHTVVAVAKVPATCLEAGTEAGTKCSACGEIQSGCTEISKLDHVGTLVQGQGATCSEAGYKDYYQCKNGCNAYFEDEACTKDIKDLETWKTAAGSGLIKALGHHLVLVPEVPKTCTTAGTKAYYQCMAGENSGDRTSFCGAAFEDDNGNTPIENLDSWKNIPASHTPGEAVTENLDEATGIHDLVVYCTICKAEISRTEVTPGTSVEHTNLVHLELKDPTCTETGLTAGAYCADGIEGNCPACVQANENYEVKQEVIPALGHTANPNAVILNWTETSCTASASCIRGCGESVTETVEFTAETVNATCEAAGSTTYTAVFTNEAFGTRTKTETINKLNHEWGKVEYNWSTDNSTCTATRKCELNTSDSCEETVTVNSTNIVTAPTCETAGYTTYSADFTVNWAADQTKKVDGDPATGHTWEVDGAPVWNLTGEQKTCTVNLKCSCNETADATLAVTEKVVKEDTCEQAGEILYTAEFKAEGDFTADTMPDALTKTEYPDVVKHIWSLPTYEWTGYTECTATRTCSVDDSHVETETVAATAGENSANCIAGGKIVHTSAAFTNTAFAVQTKDEPTDALGHDVENGFVAQVNPTCQKIGVEAHYQCDRCQKLFRTEADAKANSAVDADDLIMAVVPCSFVDYQYNNDASCTQAGTKTASCEYDCGKTSTIDDADHPQLGHVFTNYVYNKDASCLKAGTETAECDTCDTGAKNTRDSAEYPQLKHEYEEEVLEAATCTTTGTMQLTCKNGCDYRYTEEISKLGHAYKQIEGQAATCYAEGWKNYYQCAGDDETRTYCGLYFANVNDIASIDLETWKTGDGKLEKVAHDYESVVTAPTCLEKGYTTYTCKNCPDGTEGHSYVADYKDALEHKYDTGVVTTQPSCTAEGIKTFTCQNDCCNEQTEGHTYTEPVDALGHELVKIDGQAPTCDAAGYNAYYQCAAVSGTGERSHCGYYFASESDTAADAKVIATTEDALNTWKTTLGENGGAIAQLQHKDTDNDHLCDQPGCDDKLTECVDENADHNCDFEGCKKPLSECVDNVKDHLCDYAGCQKKLSDCVDVDTDQDHLCDHCGQPFGEHKFTEGQCNCGYVQDLKVTITIVAEGTSDQTLPEESIKYGNDGAEYTKVLDLTSYGDCYTIQSVSAKVGGKEVESTYQGNALTIASEQLTGDIVITVNAYQNHVHGSTKTDITAAKCEEEGKIVTTLTCKNCGKPYSTETEIIPALKHEYNAVYTEPTFDADGFTTYTCKNGCGDSYTETDDGTQLIAVARIGSTRYQTLKEAIEAAGKRDTIELLAKCVVEDTQVWDKNITMLIPAVDDNYGLVIKGDLTIKSGTFVVNGFYGIGVSGSLTIDGGTFELEEEVDNDYLIGSWGTTVINGGTFVGQYNCVNAFQGTVEIKGGNFTTADKDCTGEYDSSDVLAEDEDGTAVITSGTFSKSVEDYLAEGHCQRKVGEKYYVAPHSSGEAVQENTVPATCTDNGSYQLVTKCTRCDAELSREDKVIDATGHTVEVIEGKAATCLEPGYHEAYHCTVCGGDYATRDDENDKLLSGKIEDLTAWQNEGDGKIDALGHDLVHTEEVPAACETSGVKEYWQCSRCKAAFEDKQETTPIADLETWKAEGGDGYISATDHNYTSEVTTQPTCTEDGVRTYTCQNDKSHTKTEVVSKLNHDYAVEYKWNEDRTACTASAVCKNNPNHNAQMTAVVSVSVTTAADCENDGAGIRTAAFATNEVGIENQVENVVIPATGHSFTKYVSDNNATCTEDGTKTAFCDNKCGKKETVDDVDSAKGHSMQEIAEVPATCTNDGIIHHYFCGACLGRFHDVEGKQPVETGKHIAPALQHDYQTTVTEPDCENEGYTTYTCSRGDHTYKDNYVDALGHDYDWDGGKVVTAPTCDEDGYTTYDCARCDETHIGDQVTATGHDYKNMGAKAGTCTEVGWKAYYQCQNSCGLYYEYLQDQKVHSLIGDADALEAWKTGDGQTSAYGHNWQEVAGKTPDCDDAGYLMSYQCGRSACGLYFSEKDNDKLIGDEAAWNVWITEGGAGYLEPNGHTPGEKKNENVVAPKCNAEGSHDEVIKCTVCTAEISSEHVVDPKIPHTEVTIPAVAPDCTNTGLTEGKKCSACGEILEVQVVVKANGHTTVVDPAVEATCTATGLTEGAHCDICKVTLKQQTEVSMKAHSYTVKGETITATCTVNGSQVWKCATCDATRTDVLEAKGHNSDVTIDKVAPTCTEPGLTEGKKCSVCGETQVAQEKVAATGHTKVSAVAQEDSTCKDEGVKAHYFCDVCDTYYEGRSTINETYLSGPIGDEDALAIWKSGAGKIDKKPHTEKTIDAVSPTCTETGLTSGVECSVCGEILVDRTLVDAKGHTAVIDKAVAPTCTETGLTEGEHCSVCGDTLNKQETIPATGHLKVTTIAQEDPTCTADGVKEYYFCADCDKNYATKKSDTELSGEIDNLIIWKSSDGKIDKLGHKEEVIPAVAPTCTAIGLTAGKKCTVCGETTVAQDTIPASGHKEVVDGKVDPTCTETGLTEGKHCSVCNDVLTEQEVIEAKGHTGEVVVGLAAKCEADGWKDYYQCKDCKLYFQDEACEQPIEDLDAWKIAEDGGKIAQLGHSWDEGRVTTLPTCTEDGIKTFTCGTCNGTRTEAEPKLGHDLEAHDAQHPTYYSVGWEAYETCTRCEYSTYESIEPLGEPSVGTFDEFMSSLKLLEEYANDYVKANPSKDPMWLLIKYVRTGVDRYNSGSWNIMAGYEDESFADYVMKREEEFNKAAPTVDDMINVTGIKNIKNFTLSNGDSVDFGHMFGTMDITYHNKTSINHADVAGWAGDLVDLLSTADRHDVTGSVDEMIKEIGEKYLNHSIANESDQFSQTDMYGDLDGYYFMNELIGEDYEPGMLYSMMEKYFVSSLTTEQRADYFLKNRLGGVTSRGDIRDAVFSEYTDNSVIATLEGTREFKTQDIADMRKACCYAFADYLCKLAGDYVELGINKHYTVYSTEKSTLAPGITQEIHKGTTTDNENTVFYVVTADVNNPYVNVYANYHDADPSKGWAMQRVLDQANAAQARYGDPASEDYIENYNVVASTNGAGYNMSTGEPGGVLMMGGVEYHAPNGNGFFGIRKDGTPCMGSDEDYYALKEKGELSEAIAIFGNVLVKDGKLNVSTNDYSRASRTAIGYTKTGKVVLMVMDGRQVPVSCGGSMAEIAQVMLEAGCVWAVNMDGGGSSTYVAKQEGEDELSLVSTPSDGFMRSVSTSWLVVSTAPSSTAFDHAALESEVKHLTVGATVQVTASGVSATGNPAELPEGVTWAVSDTSVATISEDGVVTGVANGQFDVQLMLDDEIVGSRTMYVVVPDAVYFTKENMNAIYGEPATLPVAAKYENKPVAIVEEDVSFTLSNTEAGTTDGFTFTGIEASNIKTVKVTAHAVNNSNATSGSININLFKPGEASFDFENADGGDRLLAWNRVVSNSTTVDSVTYTAVDKEEPMITEYTFGMDMTQIPMPEELIDLVYMLPGADVEGNNSAWDFLLQLAERVSVLTEVKATIKLDPNFDVDYTNLSVNCEYFALENTAFDAETNELVLSLRWKDQTKAIDPDTANPIVILAGIKLTPKDDAAWDAKDRLAVVNGGNISYDIYLRANALYSFACKPENQEAYKLYPFVNNDVIINGAPESGGHFSDVYKEFNDEYTLNKGLKNGWVYEDGGYAYYEDGVKYTGVRKVGQYYYDFGENGINIGQTKYSGMFVENGKNCYAKNGVPTAGWVYVEEDRYCFDENGVGYDGEAVVDEVELTFDNGLMTGGYTGFLKKSNGKTYHYIDGISTRGWYNDGEYWYFFFAENGIMITGTHVTCHDRSTYYDFDSNGRLLRGYFNGSGYYYWAGEPLADSWVKAGNDSDPDAWYRTNSHGHFVTDPTGKYPYEKEIDGVSYTVVNIDIDGVIYTFDNTNGKLLLGNIAQKEGKLYFYWAGEPVNGGWFDFEGETYYAYEDGHLATGAHIIDGESYMFSPQGALIEEGTTLSVTMSSNSSQMTIKTSEVEEVTRVRMAVWSDENGQDDLVWFEATTNGDGVWTLDVPMCQYENTGTYHIHVYEVDEIGALINLLVATTYDVVKIRAVHTYDDKVDGTCNICGVDRATVETRKVVHMFRLYNPYTHEHFYTGSETERENLVALGWQYEGVGFTFPANTGAPVHRLYDPETGEHLYTMDEEEKTELMDAGWTYEGVAFNSAYDTEAVQHRLHNPYETVGAYHFTFSEEEMNNLIAAGWEYQGIGWYSCWK